MTVMSKTYTPCNCRLLLFAILLLPCASRAEEKAGSSKPAAAPVASHPGQAMPAPTSAAEQYRRGERYFLRKGSPSEIAEACIEAVKWYRQAADQGHTKAQRRLGFCYYGAYGVPRDMDESLRWYLKAANQGESGAQFDLGRLYECGDGVPQDKVVGYMWYLISAASGNVHGKFYVEEAAKEMTDDQVAEARLRSNAWQAAKAAEKK